MQTINASFSLGYSQQRINSLTPPPQLVNKTSTPIVNQTSTENTNFILQTLTMITGTVANLYNFVIILIVINVVLLAIIIYLILPSHKHAKEQLKAGQKRLRQRQPK
jgi:predicted PurR-regulated permease PerM